MPQNSISCTSTSLPVHTKCLNIVTYFAINFFHALGRKILAATNVTHAKSPMIQQISVALQTQSLAHLTYSVEKPSLVSCNVILTSISACKADQVRRVGEVEEVYRSTKGQDEIYVQPD